MVFVACFSDTTFTAVAADKLAASGEAVDRQATLIRTALAFGHGSGVFQRINAVDGQHGTHCAFLVAFSCNQCSAKSAHDPGNIRPDCFTAGNFFKTAQNTVVVECTALNHNMTSKFGSICYFYYLI